MSLFGDLGTRKELENKAKAEGRLPPGQSLTLKWPLLHYGSIPHFDPARWDFQISGEVEEAKRLTWNDFRTLPQTETQSDFHCVTRWSRLDNHWKGVLFTDVMKLIKPKPSAQFASILAEEGYTANVPLADLCAPTCCLPLNMMANHSPANMAARCASSFRNSTPGKASSGSVASCCSTTTASASGSATAITPTAIRGKNNATLAAE